MCFCILIGFWVSNIASSRCKVFLGVKDFTIFGCQRLGGQGDID